MIFHRFLVIFSLLHLVILVPAQNFKVIKETDDYILKECDSGFYNHHGIEAKRQLLIGEEIKVNSCERILKKNNVLKLKMENGKTIKFKDHNMRWRYPHYEHYSFIEDNLWDYGENKRDGYYLIKYCINSNISMNYLLINKKNGMIDTIEGGRPFFSPNGKVYSYCYEDPSKIFYIKFKNLGTNKISSFEIGNQMPIDKCSISIFKWIDDYSFLIYSLQYGRITPNPLAKYYLVEIKK